MLSSGVLASDNGTISVECPKKPTSYLKKRQNISDMACDRTRNQGWTRKVSPKGKAEKPILTPSREKFYCSTLPEALANLIF